MTKASDFIATLQLDTVKNSADLGARIAQNLCNFLDVESVIIGMPIDIASSRIKVVAAAANGLIAPKFEYELADTPCMRVYEDKRVLFPCDLDHLYPIEAPLGWQAYAAVPIRQSGEPGIKGHIAAFSVRPLHNESEAHELLEVAARLLETVSLNEIDASHGSAGVCVRKSPDVDLETGLATLSYLEARGKLIFQNCASKNIPLCMAVFEISHLGRPHKDDLGNQQLIGSIIRTHVGPHRGLAARLGRNEYAIVLPEASIDQLQYLLVTIDVAIKHAFSLFSATQNQVATRLSSGAASRRPDDDSFGVLLRRAQMELFSRTHA